MSQVFAITTHQAAPSPSQKASRFEKVVRKGSLGFENRQVLLAVEPRLSPAPLNVGGFYLQAALPEVDPVNFASRVNVPVIMLNGRFDFFFPTETSQEPMFRHVGTPAEHKRRVVYDSSHALPRNEVRECVAWVDKYWGPAQEPTD